MRFYAYYFVTYFIVLYYTAFPLGGNRHLHYHLSFSNFLF